MNILIPLEEKNEDAQIANIGKEQGWVLIDLHEGKIQKMDFYDTWQEIDDFIECVVVKDKGDYTWPFFEQSIPVLEAFIQRDIEDIIEAFLFKELYEVTM